MNLPVLDRATVAPAAECGPKSNPKISLPNDEIINPSRKTVKLARTMLREQYGVRFLLTASSPSDWVYGQDHVAHRGEDPPILFTRSTHPSRTLSVRSIESLREWFPGLVVDPEFPDKLSLFQAVDRAQYVISTDSGAVHVAEMMSTPWVCIHSTFCRDTRHVFYKHGRCTFDAAHFNNPCYRHGGCDRCSRGPVEVFDARSIKHYVNELLKEQR